MATKKAKRSVASSEDKSPISPEMKRLAVEMHLENAKANEHGRKAEKAREALYKAMKDAGVKEFNAETRVEKGTLSLVASIATPKRNVVDVAKLERLIPREQFVRCVSASQKAVTDVAGTEIATQVLVETLGTENVSVKPLK